jgi:hypothetical protein
VRLELLLVGLLAGCATETEAPERSRVGRVQAKSGEVWGRDLAQGLGLEAWDLCHELGDVDCITDAHRITLGGVEPTVLGIDEPLEHAAVSAPIAVDRVATSACAARYELDQAGPAVIFGPVLSGDVRSTNDRLVVARTLVERLLGRRSTTDEDAALIDLLGEIEPLSSDLTRDWSVGACVIVATSTEALFY